MTLTFVEKEFRIELTNVEEKIIMGNDQEKRLPETELEVMNVIWENGNPMKTSEIAQKVGKDWSMSTIQALLARLEAKGFVRVEKKERLKMYYPLVKEEVYREQETKRFFEKFHRKSMKSLLLTLVKNENLSEKDLEELEEIIRKEGNNK